MEAYSNTIWNSYLTESGGLICRKSKLGGNNHTSNTGPYFSWPPSEIRRVEFFSHSVHSTIDLIQLSIMVIKDITGHDLEPLFFMESEECMKITQPEG